MQNILEINTVTDYLELRNYEVLHPLVGIVDFNKVCEEGYTNPKYDGFQFKCFAIFLKDAEGCKLKYGGKDYDYDEGTLVFMAPVQTVEVGGYETGYVPKGYAMLFHPDLLLRTDLARKMHLYGFFLYASHEALHLSTKERKVLLSLIDKIQFELEQNMDKHSKKLIVANIELFLNYCSRFYDRQFITRNEENTDILQKFEAVLSDYFESDRPQTLGLPSVTYCAEMVHLSTNYFGDLIRKETGKTALEYIQLKVVNKAKQEILENKRTISEIAYGLGFKYPQHFTRVFKRKVGVSPNEFRNLN